MTGRAATSRGDVVRHRIHVHELARTGAHTDAAVLDLGVQDTGPDGAGWALELRGAQVPADDLVLAWTLRGAPHLYRRAEVAQVAAATSPWSDADAAKRIFDAARPLKAAGIGVLDALDHLAEVMRELAAQPVTKGELSAELTRRLEEPYLRHCRACDAVHAYEQPFRLAALRAGLELEPRTSPPVLRRIPGWRGPAARFADRLDPVRAALHLLGPTTPKLVADFVDAPVKEVRARWPDDVVDVAVDGETEGEVRQVLADDVDGLADPPAHEGVLLLGPFDLFLQARDRDLLVPDDAARKDLWRTLGRPGAVLADGELVGSWRPRSKGGRLGVAYRGWSRAEPPAGLAEQAERLAAWRGQAFSGFVEE
ncbi:DNA glycosylase AlkZ-like family protein [Nocardioides sp. SYSU D00038]|uniref:DNA glycosylase AlkZ-like family protein n=1 Tax=Nocardioides sp. SYSU D00038 TaxID=2812554 RepID=UPI0019670637|nr:crosslink repair DNA glycosylase YcaQ family protein [Nocardioides sp. SYSU D00038]